MMSDPIYKVALVADATQKNILPFIGAFGEVDAVFLTAVLAAGIAIWGINSQWAIARRQLTLQNITKVDNDQDMIEARREFIKLALSDEGIEKYARKEFDGSEEAEKIRLVLNSYEIMAIGCQKKILDFDLIERYSRSSIIRYWAYAERFVIELRRRTQNNRIYHEFESLANTLAGNKPKRWFVFPWIR